MGGAISLLLAAAAGAAPASLPDIELAARVNARKVKIEQDGRAEVRIEPDAGKRIDVRRNLPKGRSTYRNLELRLTIEARLADPAAGPAVSASAETASHSGE